MKISRNILMAAMIVLSFFAQEKANSQVVIPYRAPNVVDSKLLFEIELRKALLQIRESAQLPSGIAIDGEAIGEYVDLADEAWSEAYTEELITNPALWTTYRLFKEASEGNPNLNKYLNELIKFSRFSLAAKRKTIARVFIRAHKKIHNMRQNSQISMRPATSLAGNLAMGFALEFIKQWSLALLEENFGSQENWEYITASAVVDHAFAGVSASIASMAAGGGFKASVFLLALTYEEANITLDRIQQLYGTVEILQQEKYRTLISLNNAILTAANGRVRCVMQYRATGVNNGCMNKTRENLDSIFNFSEDETIFELLPLGDVNPDWISSLKSSIETLISAKISFLRNEGDYRYLMNLSTETAIYSAEDYAFFDSSRTEVLRFYLTFKESFLDKRMIQNNGGYSCQIGSYNICQ